MKDRLRQHAFHVAMCAPMLIVAIVLLVSGSAVGVLVPVVGCVLMMGLMMKAMSGSGQSR